MILRVRELIYYAEPMDQHTNEVIASMTSNGENAQENLACGDGQRHDLWRMSYQALAKLIRSARSDKNLRFSCWWQEGENGVIRPYKPKSRFPKKVKKKRRPLRRRA